MSVTRAASTADLGDVSMSGLSAARAVADALLYEGYLLYPYRRSSAKNRMRFQFGVLLPEPWARAHGLDDAGVAGSAESWWQQTECLLQAAGTAEADILVRFLQVQRRSVQELLPDGSYRPVTSLGDADRLELSFDEAVAHEIPVRVRMSDLLAGELRSDLAVPGGEDEEPLADRGQAGRVVRQRMPVAARIAVSARCREGSGGLVRLRIRVDNTGDLPVDAPREEALRFSLIACHALVTVRGGSFVSLLDPPEEARPAARACQNVHTFPVLAGEPGRRDLVLSSPIILYDYPRVAPESPGDLHDATEIDEILSLRTLTLTDAEKREARATDKRAAAILDRIDGMPAAVHSRLHGAIRSFTPANAAAPADECLTAPETEKSGGEGTTGQGTPGRQPPDEDDGRDPGRPDLPWWDPGADDDVSPATDSVTIRGVRLVRGSRVRLRPRRRGTDPQDMFLDGRTAQVDAVLTDVDGSPHLAVTLEDDPGAELNRWYGRYRYFQPEEVEPVPDGGTST